MLNTLKKGIFLLFLFALSGIILLNFSNKIETDYGNTTIISVKTSVDNADTDSDFISCRLYLPETAGEDSPVPGILLLTPSSGCRFTSSDVAIELSRRGYAVLVAEICSAEQEMANNAIISYTWLSQQSFINSSRMAIWGEKECTNICIETASVFADSDLRPRAVLLFADSFPDILLNYNISGNILLFDDSVSANGTSVTYITDSAGYSAFLNCGQDQIKMNTIYGYFAEESARKIIPEGENFSTNLSTAIDWVGSSLGHPNSLYQDDEYIYTSYNYAIILSIILSAVSILLLIIIIFQYLSHRRKHTVTCNLQQQEELQAESPDII